MDYKIINNNFKIQIPINELGIQYAEVELEDGTKVQGKLLKHFDENKNQLFIGPNIVFTKDVKNNLIHTLVTVNFGKVPGNILSLTSRIPSKIQLNLFKQLYIYFVQVGKSFFDAQGNSRQTWLDLVYSKKANISRQDFESLNEDDSWSSMISTPFYKLVQTLVDPSESSLSKEIIDMKKRISDWLNEKTAFEKEDTNASKLPENKGIIF